MNGAGKLYFVFYESSAESWLLHLVFVIINLLRKFANTFAVHYTGDKSTLSTKAKHFRKAYFSELKMKPLDSIVLIVFSSAGDSKLMMGVETSE